jgi:hypothetical protein
MFRCQTDFVSFESGAMIGGRTEAAAPCLLRGRGGAPRLHIRVVMRIKALAGNGWAMADAASERRLR